MTVDKTFYASGFLYHPYTQKILLQQSSSLPSFMSPWSLFSTECKENEEAGGVFKHIIFDLLRVKIAAIDNIYSYFNEKTSKDHVVVYSVLEKLQDFPAKNNSVFAWFSFKDILKLHINDQVRHDIIVGQRVILASERKNRGEYTFQ